MKLPHRIARPVALTLLAHMVLAPCADALGPLTPVDLQITRAAPRMNERERTLDYPVTFTNATAQAIAGPIQILAPLGTQNVTVHTEYDPESQPPQKHYVTLPTSLAPGQSFTQIFRIVPSRIESPRLEAFVESIGPVDPATAPAPAITSARPGEYVVDSDWPLRIRAVIGQEWLWDADATNPNGGTLSFTLAPIPNPKPDLAGAAYPTGATIDPVTGVLRWTPTATGLHAARLTVSDGVANATAAHDLAFVVANPGEGPPPLTCNPWASSVSSPGAEIPLNYSQVHYDDLVFGGSPNVVVAPGRTASCTPVAGTMIGEGAHAVRCQTNDALWPAGSCEFQANVTPGYLITIPFPQEYVNLRIEGDACQQTGGLIVLCSGVGSTSFTVRSTGLGVAHDVVITIPIPASASAEAIGVVSPGVVSPCLRIEAGPDDVSLVCEIGDLASGEAYPMSLVLASDNYAQAFPLSTATVTTATPELTTIDNSVQVRFANMPEPPSGTLEELFICQGPPPGLDCPCDEEDPIDVCKAEVAKEWAEYMQEQECRRNAEAVHGFAGLIHQACEEQPAWFRYVIMGAFGVAALVTGAGAALWAFYGPSNLSIFTAGEIGASAAMIL